MRNDPAAKKSRRQVALASRQQAQWVDAKSNRRGTRTEEQWAMYCAQQITILESRV